MLPLDEVRKLAENEEISKYGLYARDQTKVFETLEAALLVVEAAKAVDRLHVACLQCMDLHAALGPFQKGEE